MFFDFLQKAQLENTETSAVCEVAAPQDAISPESENVIKTDNIPEAIEKLVPETQKDVDIVEDAIEAKEIGECMEFTPNSIREDSKPLTELNEIKLEESSSAELTQVGVTNTESKLEQSQNISNNDTDIANKTEICVKTDEQIGVEQSETQNAAAISIPLEITAAIAAAAVVATTTVQNKKDHTSENAATKTKKTTSKKPLSTVETTKKPTAPNTKTAQTVVGATNLTARPKTAPAKPLTTISAADKKAAVTGKTSTANTALRKIASSTSTAATSATTASKVSTSKNMTTSMANRNVTSSVSTNASLGTKRPTSASTTTTNANRSVRSATTSSTTNTSGSSVSARTVNKTIPSVGASTTTKAKVSSSQTTHSTLVRKANSGVAGSKSPVKGPTGVKSTVTASTGSTIAKNKIPTSSNSSFNANSSVLGSTTSTTKPFTARPAPKFLHSTTINTLTATTSLTTTGGTSSGGLSSSSSSPATNKRHSLSTTVGARKLSPLKQVSSAPSKGSNSVTAGSTQARATSATGTKGTKVKAVANSTSSGVNVKGSFGVAVNLSTTAGKVTGRSAAVGSEKKPVAKGTKETIIADQIKDASVTIGALDQTAQVNGEKLLNGNVEEKQTSSDGGVLLPEP